MPPPLPPSSGDNGEELVSTSTSHSHPALRLLTALILSYQTSPPARVQQASQFFMASVFIIGLSSFPNPFVSP